MRFPFFATNRTVNWVRTLGEISRTEVRKTISNNYERLLDEQKLRHKLEERVAKLEEAKKHGRKKRN